MRINVESLSNPLSAVRGIGSYNQMLKEGIARYGQKNGLELSNQSYDLELITDFNPFQKISLKAGVSQAIVIHDLIPLKYARHFPIGLKGKFVWWQNCRIISQLAGIITDSQVVKQELIQTLSVSADKINVVYPAAKAIYETKSPVALPKFIDNIPRNYILYNADVTWNKNLPRLAQAIKKINQTLVLAGAALTKRTNLNHPWLKSFVEFLKETQNDKRFIFLGFVSDMELKWLYQNAKTVALPSLAEGFGLPWLEACWQESPVVVGRTAVTQEIMGEAAYYVDPLKVSSIASGLENVMFGDNGELIKRQKKQAQKYSQSHFVDSLKTALYNLLNND
ncbi:hypothetical protein A2313_01790 [Candidatus Roizmanbacteria bacterium RIFOXYB2_FULL_41_10]|uniref:Glycosyl transferase family 1 domain-containing protein n=1 Tax=Candidatus Roizmanbacteria bacterium RIFOXYA1_FULL_41_12 TaxID=1802082 RepID=A0A1F7K5P3_9BACT|nr:MAG: hypothetical protein A2209_02845 [Candidatus Roizmanbacteria bacterium RIFOXYA1_FULL_41_12]OGK66666.1 MAG: hypothetical protein A2262_03435 [Candidatus Roizmanbacteria bacterium RIFOXYA2_FULL_41_8]OGK67522.1 MAG: hypothetical protein A2377_01595 [Candidatus Roizmanbacteria bacterium RIFOXYB1_FULL_41_27]OGK71178.1 MAG: hypothetical protein A2403_00325 [Candidatus Roizmanbacteria bacterium RIFOXYC1_FULL_41_16]OGK72056.1 MAG: hypothetical protein A2313_01790 [Candidatus Roizmanbacteria bac